MSNQEICIIGAGSYGEAVLDLAQACGYKVLGFYDDDASKKGTEILGVTVLGTTEELFSSDLSGKNYTVAIGNNPVRRGLLEKIRSLGGQTPSLIHPSVIVSEYAEIGQGVIIQPKTFIWTRVTIEDDCIVSPGVVIAHHSTLKQGSFVSTLSSVGSNIIIEKDVFVGMGCTIMTGVKTVGENTTVGAGTVVIRDVEPNSIIAGVPAKLIRYKD